MRKTDINQEQKVFHLPQYKVIIHNDDINSMEHIVMCLVKIFGFPAIKAIQHMKEAHLNGLSIVTITHLELAETYCERLSSAGITATMESA